MLAVVSTISILCVPGRAQNRRPDELQAQELYRTAWTLVRDTYYDSSYNGQNWQAWEHKFDGTLNSQSDAMNAIEKMLSSLDDPYTRLVRQPTAAGAARIASARRSYSSVSFQMLEGNIGYIKISSMSAIKCARQFAGAVKNLSAAKSLILDLRGNRGGLVANALEIANMLLQNGTIVTTISRDGSQTFTASGDPITSQPIVLLVDHESASAAEILTGALKDNNRATVIGTKTFGKGLVQEVRTLPGGTTVKITVARYLTPGGYDINKIALTPDIELEDSTDSGMFATKYLSGNQTACTSYRMPAGNTDYAGS